MQLHLLHPPGYGPASPAPQAFRLTLSFQNSLHTRIPHSLLILSRTPSLQDLIPPKLTISLDPALSFFREYMYPSESSSCWDPLWLFRKREKVGMLNRSRWFENWPFSIYTHGIGHVLTADQLKYLQLKSRITPLHACITSPDTRSRTTPSTGVPVPYVISESSGGRVNIWTYVVRYIIWSLLWFSLSAQIHGSHDQLIVIDWVTWSDLCGSRDPYQLHWPLRYEYDHYFIHILSTDSDT